jgi:hypothetical protein
MWLFVVCEDHSIDINKQLPVATGPHKDICTKQIFLMIFLSKHRHTFVDFLHQGRRVVLKIVFNA